MAKKNILIETNQAIWHSPTTKLLLVFSVIAPYEVSLQHHITLISI